MEKIKVFFKHPRKFKLLNEYSFIIKDYTEPLLIVKGKEICRIILFVAIISKKYSKRICLGYFTEQDHFDYLSVSIEEKFAEENLKRSMTFLFEKFKVINIDYLKYSYLYVKGEIGFTNGEFDFRNYDLVKEKNLLNRKSNPKKLSITDKIFKVKRIRRVILRRKNLK